MNSEAKVCCLITKLYSLSPEIDLEINMRKQRVPTEGNCFSRSDTILNLGREMLEV